LFRHIKSCLEKHLAVKTRPEEIQGQQ
jgi:hypothetical protein